MSKPSLASKINDFAAIMRLNQPIGIWLLFLPCLFGVFLALKKMPNPEVLEILKMVSLFFVGSVVMRSAGCIINDFFDQKFDKKVERTKNRPLSAKRISKSEALTLLVSLLLIGLIILLQFNQKVIFSGFVALCLVFLYPLMKRITYYPQIFLGLTFNFGILMASLAILSEITPEALILYFCSIIWTLIYDTIYAYQDIEDDLKIGIKSTAIKFQKNTKKILIALSATMLLGFFYLGILAQFKSTYFFIILVISLVLIKEIKGCNFKDPKSCLALFKKNFWIGLSILVTIIFG